MFSAVPFLTLQPLRTSRLYSSGDLLKKLKENKNAMIFTNLAEHKVFDVPAAFIRANKKPIDASQGYYLRETEIVKIRFAREE